MESSVVEELLEENARLREALAQVKDSGFVSLFHILEREPILKIAGVLITEGVWKGIKYTYDELKKALSKLRDLPGKVMHGHSEEFKDRTIGKITRVGTDDILKAITFEAEIHDPRAAELVKDGTFRGVSLKGMFRELTSNVPPEGVDYTPIEWSLTGSPAVDNALLFRIEELSKSLNLGVADETTEMSENEVEEFEVRETDLLVLPENWDELPELAEAELEVYPMEQFEELAKKKRRVVRVPAGKYPKVAKKVRKYYGYPYPYYYYPYYYYYYPYYYQYGLEEILDVLPLQEDYRTYMKECLKSGKDMKTCAAEWKPKVEEKELAKITCPVCKKEFDSKDEFMQHWKDKHEEKYGEYGTVEKLFEKLATDPKIRSHLKAILELSGDKEEILKDLLKEANMRELAVELLIRRRE